MTKNKIKSQASSSRAVSLGFGGFGSVASSSPLSYLTEPPDLIAIGNPHISLALKNLSKRDEKTRSKALQDFQAHINSEAREEKGIEDSVIEAWVKVYPRLAIDASRTVRDLSHSSLYDLLSLSQKRMSIHVSKFVGSWLAGQFDRDRTVASNVTKAINSFLQTDTKRVAFYARHQASALKYAYDAIRETPETLSDERSMSKEDMLAKYFTVLGTSLSLVVELLRTLDETEIAKLQENYNDLLSDEKLWQLVSCEDNHVRRIICDLLVQCCQKQRKLISKILDILVKTFIFKGLAAPQIGTASRILDALRALTCEFPQVWNLKNTNKSSRKGNSRNPLTEINNFISLGPRMDPNDFWKSLQLLIQVLPSEVLPKDTEESAEFLQVLETGISQKNEIRQSRKDTWSCYLNIAEFLSTRLTDGESKSNLLRRKLFPLFGKYLHMSSTPDQSLKKFSHRDSADIDISIVLQAYNICSQQTDQDIAFCDEWKQLAAEVVARIQTSLPEQSRDFRLSQDSVIELTKLWFSLLSESLKFHKDVCTLNYERDPLFKQSKDIVQAAFKTMISREGRPYCAAGTLKTAVYLAPALFTSDPYYLNIVREIVIIHLPKLLHSPSVGLLIQIIFQLPSLYGSDEYFESSWHGVVDTFLSSLHVMTTKNKTQIAIDLISNDAVALLVKKHRELQNFFLKEIDSYVHGNYSCKSILCAAFQSGSLSESSAILARDSVIEYLSGGYDLRGGFFILELLNSNMPHLMNKQSNVHVNLLTKLMEIKEKALSEQEVDLKFADQSQILMDAIMIGTSIDSMSHLISNDLEKIGRGSYDMSVGRLIQEAKDLVEEASNPNLLKALIPNSESWRKCLLELLDRLPGAALAAISQVGSAVHLICCDTTPANLAFRPSFDAHGFGMPMRKALYTAELLPLLYESLEANTLTDILEMLFLTFEVAVSDASLQESRLFVSELFPEDVDILTHFLQNTVSKLKIFAGKAYGWPGELKLITEENCPNSASETPRFSGPGIITIVMRNLITRFINICQTRQPVSFYAAQALSRLLGLLFQELDCDLDVENWLSDLDTIKPSTQNIVGASAIMIGLGGRGKSSQTTEKLCNQLISNVPGLPINSEDIVSQLAFLNSCLSVYDGMELPVAKNRLVFAVKHLKPWTENLEDTRIVSEVCRSLQKILPSIKDIYGSHWEASLKLCISIWTKQNDLPICDDNLTLIGESLKLYSQLKEIEDPNDDLSEALIDFGEQISSSLLDLLFAKRSKNHQPLQAVDQILASLVFNIPAEQLGDIDKYYPLLATEHLWVQSAAYMLIFRHLSTLQQQLSVEVLLENKDELLSLIISTPCHIDLNMLRNKLYATSSEFISSIRSYLLAWLLVFETFSASSYKVRNDYNDVLKSQKCIGPFMDFVFHALGHVDDEPVDLKKEDINSAKIREYNLQTSLANDDMRKDLIWILVSLYFQALKYAPSIVKGWWLDTKKQTKNNICNWTENFISPILVDEELSAVATWAENQESPDDEGKNLVVKVAKKAREVSVGYEIDDMMMQILIRVPETYPLELVKVESRNRVGISAQKWNSFLMTTHGVINFSNGSISDALFVFRKNILGALKGHVECAICYSIISADRKVPDKKCATCQNLFHSNCLFQWFKSSNQSSCPLCRNPFNY